MILSLNYEAQAYCIFIWNNIPTTFRPEMWSQQKYIYKFNIQRKELVSKGDVQWIWILYM